VGQDHQWLIPTLWATAGVSLVLAVASSRRFRALFGSQEAITEKAAHQGMAVGSIATAVGSIGAGATVVISPVTSPGSHIQARPMPTIMCSPTGTNLRVESIASEVINVRLVPIASDQYILRSHVIRYLRPSSPDTLVLYSKRKEASNYTEYEASQFFTDLGPSVPGLEVSEMFERYIKYLDQERLIVPIELAYSAPDGAAHYRAAYSLRRMPSRKVQSWILSQKEHAWTKTHPAQRRPMLLNDKAPYLCLRVRGWMTSEVATTWAQVKVDRRPRRRTTPFAGKI
jgi:hypothetical protein